MNWKNLASGILVLLVLAFGSLALIEQYNQKTTIVTTELTMTSTIVSTTTSSSSVGPITTRSGPAGQVLLYRSSDNWNFSVTLSSLVVPAGH